MALLTGFEIAPILSHQNIGKEICVVGTPVCMDHQSNRHCLATIPQGERFYFDGELDQSKASYTFLRVRIQQKEPIPSLVVGDQTCIFSHDTCTWQGARQVLELCSGLGAMGQGLTAAGFQVLAACDFRAKMCDLYKKHSTAAVIHGDICKMDTLIELAKVFPASGLVAAGISCQPYSLLGDCRGGLDPRSSTLPSTLAIAYHLRAMIVVLECVGPAQHDPFVNHHINNFCTKTKFIRSDCVLELGDVWVSRRNRWWCILSAPAIGKIDVGDCKDFVDLKAVEQVMPRIRTWPLEEEEELKLTPVELEAFGDSSKQKGSHILNKKTMLPCALHCWGSQLTACPCGCREKGLSESRLREKGLYGVLVESTALKVLRHLHPQEAAAMCGLDPTLHWGREARMALGAVGQLASPVQAVWLFSHILRKMQVVQWQMTTVDPKLMLMAYRAWLLAKCKVLLYDYTQFPVTETLANSSKFEPFRAMPIKRLLACYADSSRDVTIQQVWENHEKIAPCITTFTVETHVDTEVVSEAELPPTTVCASEDETGPSASDFGLTISQVVIEDEELGGNQDKGPHDVVLLTPEGPPLQIRVTSRSTIWNLKQAEVTLHGLKRKACVISEDDNPVDNDSQALRPGSIYRCEFVDAEEGKENSPVSEDIIRELSHLQGASPAETVTTEEIISSAVVNPCTPLANLTPQGLLSLYPPVIGSYEQAVSLLEQRCEVQARLQSLTNQGDVWADDEIRWRLTRVQSLTGGNGSVIPIDPLLISSAFSGMHFKAIETFLSMVHRPDACYVTVVNKNKHWFPLILQCGENGVMITTWDCVDAANEGIHHFGSWFAARIGSRLLPIQQLKRQFSGPRFCGALSLGFIEHRVLKTVLPETPAMAEAHHMHLRRLFREAVAEATITWQPWLWGNGVGEVTPDKVGDTLQKLLVEHGVPSDHAHHRSQQAIQAIGQAQVLQALNGKAPWKSLKTLGSNVKFRFITEEELQMQIASRSGKDPIGKPSHKAKQQSEAKSQQEVALDPAKLGLQEGAFTGGGKVLSQIPLSMVGPMSEGVAIVTWSQAEPYLRSSQVVAEGPLALLVLQGPVGGCHTGLQVSKATVPARCLANQEPLLLEASLVQLGKITVSKSVAQAPVSIESVQVATVKVTVFKDECKVSWEQFCGAPLKYVIQQCPLLRYCRSPGCSCPCWHNSEDINVSDAIVDVWRRQFLRAGYKPEPPATSCIYSVCIRVPTCLLSRLLAASGEGGVYTEPRYG